MIKTTKRYRWNSELKRIEMDIYFYYAKPSLILRAYYALRLKIRFHKKSIRQCWDMTLLPEPLSIISSWSANDHR